MKSIYRNTKAKYKIIVVDNGSTDGTSEFLKDVRGLHLIINKKNLGFPAGCNVGIREVKTDFFVLLNNDVEVTKGWLTLLLDGMKADPKLGVLGPITNFCSGIQVELGAHYNSLTELESYAAAISKRKPPHVFLFPRVVFYCVLIRTAVYKEIGCLDERFGMGNFEDDDFCLRAAIARWRCAIDRHVFVHHYGSKTFTKKIPEFNDLLERNKKIFMKKWDIVRIYLENIL